MKAVFDSSAWAKRLIAERGSNQVDELCEQADRLALCVICLPEVISALNRRLREKVIKPRDYESAKTRLLEDIRDVELLNLTDEVLAQAIIVLEHCPVRAMDALHLAAAIVWRADLFVSSDRKQVAAAQQLGLPHQLV